MSFVTQEDVFDTVEPIMRGLFEEFGGRKAVTQKFPRIAYAEAMRKYGTDKPDLRNPIEMQDATEHFRGSGFKLFAGMIDMDANTRIWAIPAPGGGSRAFCDRMNAWAISEGQRGMGYISFEKAASGTAAEADARARGRSPTISAPVRTKAIREQLGLRGGDAVFFVAGLPKEFVDFAGRARSQARLRARPHRAGSLRVLLGGRFSHV